MTTNFDEVIDRRNSNSIKYDFGIERKNRTDLLPLWVADMDFPLPKVILNDIGDAVKHGIFGYSDAKSPYYDAVIEWFFLNFHWQAQREWIIKTPGVVSAIAMAIQAFTRPGDSILIQQPVYYPFSECITENGRILVNNQLVYKNGHYTIDFEDFERKIIGHNVTLFILCSPHNPVGRVWMREELVRMGEICIKHQVLVIADEIHCDFTYPGYTHTIFPSLSEEFAMNCMLCTSPSKSFNMAGLQISNIFIPNPELRARFQHQIYSSGYSQTGTLGLVACQSAYTNGHAWLSELKDYLIGNLDFIRTFLTEQLPQIKLVEPEGTYLVWLDCSALGLSYQELEHLIVDKAKLWLDSGIIFGSETSQFQRINIACPRSILKQALTQLADAVKVWEL